MSLGHSPRTVSDGLVLHLDTANTRSYNVASSSTVWKDLSGYENNGTLINGPTYSSANQGSLVFDGTNNYASTSLVPNKTQGSISVWFKMNLLKSYNGIFYNLVSGWELYADLTGVARFRTNSDNTDIVVDSTTLSASTWYNITVCWSDTSSELYTNGTLSTQDTSMGTRTTPKTLSIGDTFSGTGKLNGNISMFSVYNRSLSDTEVEQNFDALRGRYVI